MIENIKPENFGIFALGANESFLTPCFNLGATFLDSTGPSEFTFGSVYSTDSIIFLTCILSLYALSNEK